MPDEVSDLRDVVDAINKLCDTMKTSVYDDVADDDPDVAAISCNDSVASFSQDSMSCYSHEAEAVAASIYEPESIEPETEVRTVEYRDIEVPSPGASPPQRWSDATSHVSLPCQGDDIESAPCERADSDVYYTASSEVSLLSDTEPPEKATSTDGNGDTNDDRKEVVIAGHVAAMRERFESMTRTNTPCPDLVRSLSPSLEVFRNASPSPDRLA